MLALEDEFDMLDTFTVLLLYKKLDKIVDDMYNELTDILKTNILDNIDRNANLLFDIAEIDEKLTNKTINSILINPNTNHSIMFELKRNKTRLKNNLKRTLLNAIKNNKDLTELNNEIKSIVYKKVYGKTKGDGAKTLRIFRTEYTRTRTKAKLEAIEILKKQGYKISRHWLYTHEAKVPRPEHLASDGLAENEDGYFIINGYKTKGPGLFGVASEDINCRCDTECYVVRPDDN